MAISTAAQKISDAAVLHFADKGFEAGSLNGVAEMAGIKKATIYSHFKSKDALFIHVFSEAISIESAFAKECFSLDTQSGENYLSGLSDRYRQSGHLRLLLRTAFIPPEELREQVASCYESFLLEIKKRFVAGLPAIKHSEVELLAEGFLGIVDSVHVELLYASPEAAEKRRKALWHFLTRSI